VIYIDTSCLLKALRPEPLSEAVWDALNEEDSVMVSVLAELETLVQLKAEWAGGTLTRSQWRQTETRFGILRNQPPFEFRYLPAAIYQTALRQHRHSQAVYCRSLDRLHLAAMEELRVKRLMTLDELQAKVALALTWEVVRPGGQ